VEEQRVRRVVITGGGTAGWVCAVALVKHYSTMLDITLVESEEIGTVGVGEATFPSILAFHRLIELDERTFMRETQASFKLGISFENWAGLGDRYIHAFGTVGKSTWMGDFQHYWLAARADGFGSEIGDYCFENAAARAGKFAMSDKVKVSYAYHFDAGLYAAFLRRISEKMGVKRVEGKISRVEQDPESGFVKSLVLESGQSVPGDLFIDCSGFRALLIEQTLKAGFDDYGQWLRTDRAFAAQTPSGATTPPYTRAIARQAGWQWRIPLQHRVGNGLVYCSDYLSEDEARHTLLENLEGPALFEPRLLKFKAGRRLKAWDKNVVSIGLASGFIEPLESTSIHLIQIGITRLMQLFPFAGINPTLVKRYNDTSRAEFEKIRDFIILHYKLTERDDAPFWRDCRDMEIPATLTERIELFRESAMAYMGADELFRIDSWVQVMLGQRLLPRSYHHMGRMLGPERLRKALDTLQTSIAGAVERMPTHQDFLAEFCAGTDGDYAHLMDPARASNSA
jgi:tryptophan 7-halogenase